MNKNQFLAISSLMLIVVALCLIFQTKLTSPNDVSTSRNKEGAFTEKRPSVRVGEATRHASHSGQAKKTKLKLNELRKQVEQMESGAPDRMSLRSQLAYEFADQDPEAGFEWIQSLDPTGPHAEKMMTAFALRLGLNESEKWKGFWDKLTTGTLKDSFLSSAIIGMAHNDAAKAWREYQAVADVAWNRKVTDNQVFDRLAQANPEQFWEIVQELKQDQRENEDAIDYEAKFFTYAVFKDKQAAVRLFDTVVDPDKKRQYVQLYLKGLYPGQLMDFGKAVVHGNFERQDKDDILYTISNSMYSNDLGGSARLAAAIEDEEAKQKLTTKIRLYAQRQGPDIEERIEKILGPPDS